MTLQIDSAVVSGRIDESMRLLRGSYKPIPGTAKGGWYHELRSPEPGFTATAVGLLAFAESGQDFNHVKEAMSFLYDGQVRADRGPLAAGGWPTKSSMNHPVVEATAWVARYLARAKCAFQEGSPDAEAAYQWLVRNQNGDDGGWGSLRGNESRVWLTCLALRALAALDPRCEAIKAGIGWLFDNRSREGGVAWGETAGHGPSVTHTAFALVTLRECGVGRSEERLLAAYDWLEGELAGSVSRRRHMGIEHYYYKLDPEDESRGAIRLLLWHDGLPIALSALLRDPRRVRHDLVAKALHEILRVPVGVDSWNNRDGDRGESLWSVWWCLEALIELMRYLPVKSGDLVVVAEDGLLIQDAEARDRPLAALVPRRRRDLRAFLSRHWASVLVVLVMVVGVALLMAGLLNWKEVLVGLFFPAMLLFVQDTVNQRRARRALPEQPS